MPEDLTNVIEDSLTDAVIGTEPEPELEVDSSPAVEAAPVEPAPAEPTQSDPATPTEPTPDAKPVDDFDKKYGLTKDSPSGRENRIPYSRVKKITDKAVKDAQAEWEKTSSPKLKEYETKVKDYESKFSQVAEFERVMTQEPARFLEFLSSVPQYKQFFAEIDKAFNQIQLQAAGGTVDPQAQVPDDMPQPDQKFPDGSTGYSLEGLRALNAWNRTQARKEALDEVEKKYGPIRTQWESEQRLQATIPVVQRQIDEARKWPQFNENEADIVKALQADQNLTLEGAYRRVVFPKLSVDRNKIREDILREIKAQPRATSAPTSPVKPSAPTAQEGRSLEDIITEAAQSLKR